MKKPSYFFNFFYKLNLIQNKKSQLRLFSLTLCYY
nr:MAG TPA: hypothetical protein [Caudoviricetes sp.]